MKAQLKVQIKKTNAEKIRPLRHLELRKGEDFSKTSYLRDNDPRTFHMAVVKQNKAVACATFYPEITENISAKNPYRLRGMATDYAYQRMGYAKDLMNESFNELKARYCDMLWCNARLAAIDFYKFMGFKIVGELFDIPGIGPHYFMYKKLIKK